MIALLPPGPLGPAFDRFLRSAPNSHRWEELRGALGRQNKTDSTVGAALQPHRFQIPLWVLHPAVHRFQNRSYHPLVLVGRLEKSQ